MLPFSGETWTSGQGGSCIPTWGRLMAGASRIAKKHLTLMWKLPPPSNSHLACPSFYRGVIKYGEIRGLSLRRPSRGLPAKQLVSSTRSSSSSSLSLFLSGLAFLVIFYTWLSLVFEGISVQRRCRSFRRFLCSYRGGYTPFPLVH